jgi:sulfonate transport system permease protein
MTNRKLADIPGIGLVLPLAALALWQAAGTTGHIDTGLWSTPVTVLAAAGDALRAGALARDLLASLQRDVIGLAFGIPLGIAMGCFLGLSRWGNILFGPSLSALRQVALFTWIPLISLWIGNDQAGKITFIAYAVFFPVLLATENGMRQVDVKLLEVARALCLGRRQALLRVVLPAALPAILAGIHLSLIYGWVATIGADYLFSAGPGIGSALMAARSMFRMDHVIVGMAVIAAIGFLLNEAAGQIERRILAGRGL